MFDRFGEGRAQWSLGVTGLLVAIPVFFDVDFIILVPLVYALTRRTGRLSVYYAIPLLSGLAVKHAFIPPTPGPIAVAGLIGADLGWVILFGAIAGLPCMLIAGPMYGGWIAKYVRAGVPDYIDALPEATDAAPDELSEATTQPITPALPPLSLVLRIDRAAAGADRD
jgi:Gnt-I system low-affinity gluconate transporter